jgi:hypothetical protein
MKFAKSFGLTFIGIISILSMANAEDGLPALVAPSLHLYNAGDRSPLTVYDLTLGLSGNASTSTAPVNGVGSELAAKLTAQTFGHVFQLQLQAGGVGPAFTGAVAAEAIARKDLFPHRLPGTDLEAGFSARETQVVQRGVAKIALKLKNGSELRINVLGFNCDREKKECAFETSIGGKYVLNFSDKGYIAIHGDIGALYGPDQALKSHEIVVSGDELKVILDEPGRSNNAGVYFAGSVEGGIALDKLFHLDNTVIGATMHPVLTVGLGVQERSKSYNEVDFLGAHDRRTNNASMFGGNIGLRIDVPSDRLIYRPSDYSVAAPVDSE